MLHPVESKGCLIFDGTCRPESDGHIAKRLIDYPITEDGLTALQGIGSQTENRFKKMPFEDPGQYFLRGMVPIMGVGRKGTL
jgi:hypothetical protein